MGRLRRKALDEPRLTELQLRIAQAAATGASNAEVAVRFGVSPHTVRAHLRSVYERLGLRNRVAVAAYLARNGLEEEARS